uniref:Putative secreted protein n=1 Tax=Anopheles darlingi TaxID=43151 RepID=A0A2M4DG64_ANODA
MVIKIGAIPSGTLWSIAVRLLESVLFAQRYRVCAGAATNDPCKRTAYSAQHTDTPTANRPNKQPWARAA